MILRVARYSLGRFGDALEDISFERVEDDRDRPLSRTAIAAPQNSVSVARRMVVRRRHIAAVIKKVIAALKTTEWFRLAPFNAEVEPRTIRISRRRTLTGGGLMVRI
jgi:hypothetical protein